MEECNAKPTESISNKQLLEIKLKELAQTREEIKRGRESAVQAWLDSVPLIDELQNSQTILSRTNNRLTLSRTAIASLRSLLDSTGRSIRKREAKEGESKMAVARMQGEVDRSREEMESLRVVFEEKDRSRIKLKKELQIRSQSLKTLQLTRRAINMEIEAVNESVNATLRQAKSMEVDHQLIALSHEEYNALCRKSNEETGATNSRIISSDEKLRAAEMRKANALGKLEALQRLKQEMELGMQGGMSYEAMIKVPVAEDVEKLHLESGKMITQAEDSPLQSKLKESEGYSQHRSKRRARKQTKKKKKKKAGKKQSIIQRTRNFFIRKIMQLFK